MSNGSPASSDDASSVNAQMKLVVDTLVVEIRAAEARIMSEMDRIGWRVSALETASKDHQAFRAGFADEDGNLINGKTVIRRIVAVEKTITAIRVLEQMGKGALALGRFQLLLAGAILLIAIKGTWEGLEWMLTKALALMGLG